MTETLRLTGLWIGFGFLALLFIYAAARLVSAAWFRSLRDYLRQRPHNGES